MTVYSSAGLSGKQVVAKRSALSKTKGHKMRKFLSFLSWSCVLSTVMGSYV